MARMCLIGGSIFRTVLVQRRARCYNKAVDTKVFTYLLTHHSAVAEQINQHPYLKGKTQGHFSSHDYELAQVRHSIRRSICVAISQNESSCSLDLP